MLNTAFQCLMGGRESGREGEREGGRAGCRGACLPVKKAREEGKGTDKRKEGREGG